MRLVETPKFDNSKRDDGVDQLHIDLTLAKHWLIETTSADENGTFIEILLFPLKVIKCIWREINKLPF